MQYLIIYKVGILQVIQQGYQYYFLYDVKVRQMQRGKGNVRKVLLIAGFLHSSVYHKSYSLFGVFPSSFLAIPRPLTRPPPTCRLPPSLPSPQPPPPPPLPTIFNAPLRSSPILTTGNPPPSPSPSPSPSFAPSAGRPMNPISAIKAR